MFQFSLSKNDASEINRNMGCIEIFLCFQHIYTTPTINRNMGCIEILLNVTRKKIIHLINRNMGCIEIMYTLSQWLQIH